MFYTKPKTYAGRWLVKLVQASLILGIVFFGLDALGHLQSSEDAKPETAILEQAEILYNAENSQVIETALDAETYFQRALSHQYAGDYYDAIADYNRVIELNSDIPAAWLNRGVAYEQARNNYRAMSDFSRYMLRDNMTIISLSSIESDYDEVVMMSDSYRYDIMLDVQRGDVLNISVVSVTEDMVDPLIVLLNESGNPVAANDDVRRQDGSLIAMDSYINHYDVVASGRYTLQVSHAGGGSYGDVEIRIRIDN